VSEIQDEAYTEAMEEIERLEQLNDDLIADKKRMTEFAKEALTEKDAEISRLKGLLLRAVYALDNGSLAILEEMRKAARE
jgi:hypothetical protein